MRVLVTGGTGSIGRAIVAALLRRGHAVLALARSAAARDSLAALGAATLAGDLRQPAAWAEAVAGVDAVVHAAATWDDQMAEVDRAVVAALLGHLQDGQAFVYTGGCWLYGATGDAVATEDTPLAPLPAFAWAIPVMQSVLAAPGIRGMAVHPAMVYERDGGVFAPFVEDARALGHVRVVGSESVRWPLVHRDDLALLYALLLEEGRPGDVYNGAAEEGVPVGRIARTIAARLGAAPEPVIRDAAAAADDFGSSAEGYALDQQMSGAKAMRQLGWAPRHLDALAELA